MHMTPRSSLHVPYQAAYALRLALYAALPLLGPGRVAWVLPIE
jgi:hypothetical protein